MGKCKLKNVSTDGYEKSLYFEINVKVSKISSLNFYVKCIMGIKGLVLKHIGYSKIEHMEKGISRLRGFMKDSRNFKLFEEKINKYYADMIEGTPEGTYNNITNDFYTKLKLNMGISIE